MFRVSLSEEFEGHSGSNLSLLSEASVSVRETAIARITWELVVILRLLGHHLGQLTIAPPCGFFM